MKPTVFLPVFPDLVGKWWWQQVQEKWPELSEEKQLNLLRKEIVEQSDRFNKQRNFSSSSYGSRDLSVLAYGNFYFSRTWMVSTFATAETFAFTNWKSPKKGPIRILDIGSGSGSIALSTAYLLRRFGIMNPMEIDAWDYSGKSLFHAKKLHSECFELWSNSNLQATRLDLEDMSKITTNKKYDLILVGFSLNEIMQDKDIHDKLYWLQNCLAFLKKSGRLIITEPAESEISRSLHKTISELVRHEQGCFSFSPYFNGITCPMSSTDSKYFSHEVRSYPPFESTEKINRPLHLEIREVKFAMSIIGMEKPSLEKSGPEAFRIISPLKKRKGTISFWGMGADGKENQYEFQRRSLSQGASEEILGLQRGDLIRIKGNITRGNSKRIRLSNENQLVPIFIPRLDLKKF